MYLLFTSLVFAVLASCIQLKGNGPRNYQGHGITAVLHLCQIRREDITIVDICMVVFGLTAL